MMRFICNLSTQVTETILALGQEEHVRLKTYHWAVIEIRKTHKYWNHISPPQRSNVYKHNSVPYISSVCPCEEGVLKDKKKLGKGK